MTFGAPLSRSPHPEKSPFSSFPGNTFCCTHALILLVSRMCVDFCLLENKRKTGFPGLARDEEGSALALCTSTRNSSTRTRNPEHVLCHPEPNTPHPELEQLHFRSTKPEPRNQTTRNSDSRTRSPHQILCEERIRLKHFWQRNLLHEFFIIASEKHAV